MLRELKRLADRLANRGIDDAIKKIVTGLKWIKRSPDASGGGRKVRTPQDKVAVNGGPE